jgi:Ca-activated chloride channel homolog
MKKFLLALICLVTLGTAIFAQSTNGSRRRRTDGGVKPPAGNQPAQNAPVEDDDEVIKIETSLVTIPVSVFDQGGRFISGLGKNDFRIFEDGQAQQIEVFTTTEQPFTVVLLLDVSRSTQFQIEEIQDAAIAFVEQLRPQDKMMVVAFDDDLHILSEPTADRKQLRNAIRQTRFGGGTRLYDAVDFALNDRLNNIEGRKAIVLFTDGKDSSSLQANYSGTVSDAERSDTIIYTVRYDTSEYFGGGNGGGGGNTGGGGIQWPRRRGGNGGGNRGGTQWPFPWPNGGGGNRRGGRGGGQSDEDALGEHYLRDLSDKTGGKYFNASSTGNLETAFAGIADELREQYSLGYYPANEGRPGQRKSINVRVNRPNLSIRAKSSYVVGEQQDNAKLPANRLAARD